MGMGEAGSVGALSPSGCWDLGLRRRERRKMFGKERREQLRPKQPHRQVVFVRCMSAHLKLYFEVKTFYVYVQYVPVCVCVLRVDCWLLNQRLNKSCNVLAVGCGQLVSDISPFLWISLSHTTTVSLHHPPRVDDIIAGHCLFTNHPWLGLCLAEEFPVMCFLV